MRIAIRIILGIAVLVLAYFLYRTIAEPIQFENQKKERYAHVKHRLIKIREAQMAYKSVKHHFAEDFDELIGTIKSDDFMIVKTIGNPDDTTVVVKRDTFYVSMLDSMYHGDVPALDSLRWVPFEEPAEFEMQAGDIRKGAVKIYVFMARDSKPFDPEEPYQVGSMADANFAGNWE